MTKWPFRFFPGLMFVIMICLQPMVAQIVLLEANTTYRDMTWLLLCECSLTGYGKSFRSFSNKRLEISFSPLNSPSK